MADLPSADDVLETYSSASLRLNNTGEVIKASQGEIYGWAVHSKCTSRKYVKLYNKSTAPTASDTPLIRIATNASSDIENVINNFSISNGIKFSNGIGIRSTDGSADSDASDPGDCLMVNIFYK